MFMASQPRPLSDFLGAMAELLMDKLEHICRRHLEQMLPTNGNMSHYNTPMNLGAG